MGGDYFKIGNKTYRLENFKAQVKKADMENDKMKLLFDHFDNVNKDENLNSDEIKGIFNKLVDIASGDGQDKGEEAKIIDDADVNNLVYTNYDLFQGGVMNQNARIETTTDLQEFVDKLVDDKKSSSSESSKSGSEPKFDDLTEIKDSENKVLNPNVRYKEVNGEKEFYRKNNDGSLTKLTPTLENAKITEWGVGDSHIETDNDGTIHYFDRRGIEITGGNEQTKYLAEQYMVQDGGAPDVRPRPNPPASELTSLEGENANPKVGYKEDENGNKIYFRKNDDNTTELIEPKLKNSDNTPAKIEDWGKGESHIEKTDDGKEHYFDENGLEITGEDAKTKYQNIQSTPPAEEEEPVLPGQDVSVPDNGGELEPPPAATDAPKTLSEQLTACEDKWVDFVVPNGQSLSKLMEKCCKSLGIENPSEQDKADMLAKFKELNPGAVKPPRGRIKVEYLLVGTPVKLPADLYRTPAGGGDAVKEEYSRTGKGNEISEYKAMVAKRQADSTFKQINVEDSVYYSDKDKQYYRWNPDLGTDGEFEAIGETAPALSETTVNPDFVPQPVDGGDGDENDGGGNGDGENGDENGGGGNGDVSDVTPTPNPNAPTETEFNTAIQTAQTLFRKIDGLTAPRSAKYIANTVNNLSAKDLVSTMLAYNKENTESLMQALSEESNLFSPTIDYDSAIAKLKDFAKELDIIDDCQDLFDKFDGMRKRQKKKNYQIFDQILEKIANALGEPYNNYGHASSSIADDNSDSEIMLD